MVDMPLARAADDVPAPTGDAGAPLPFCADGSHSFYFGRFAPAATGDHPQTSLERVTLEDDGSISSDVIWVGAGAPVPYDSANDLFKESGEPGATVAMGMHPNGYIYALRVVSGDPMPSRPWPGDPDGNLRDGPHNWGNTDARLQVLKYGADGVENLGPIQGISADPDYALIRQLNINAADIDPRTGILYMGSFTADGVLDRLLRIGLDAAGGPSYLGDLKLSDAIGLLSGDFAIDESGDFAYGLAREEGTTNAISYRIDLGNGTVTRAGPFVDSVTYDAMARLQDGRTVAYTRNGGGTVRILSVDGLQLEDFPGLMGASSGGDGASCLPDQSAAPGVASIPTLGSFASVLLAGLIAAVAVWRRRRKGMRWPGP